MFFSMKKLSLRNFIVSNLVLAVLLINTLIFGPSLKMGEAFTNGLAMGIGAGWLIFFAAGLGELRKPGRRFDERVQRAFINACAFTFWVLMLCMALSIMLLKSTVLGLQMDGKDVVSLGSELGFATFSLSFFVFLRKS